MISPFELAIITVGFILFFGYRRLPNVGNAIGQTVAELRHADDRPLEDDQT